MNGNTASPTPIIPGTVSTVAPVVRRCYVKLKEVSRRWVNDNEGHCSRPVTWAIDTPLGRLFMCNVDFDKYMERHCVDASHIHRLSDNERDFNESHPGAGVKGGRRK